MPSVLHVVSSLQLGGAERFTIDLATLQRKQGLDSRILSLGSENDVLVTDVLRSEIPLSSCPLEGGRIATYRAISKLFSAADVVHIHSPFALKFLAPLIYLRPLKRYIYTRHGLGTFDSLTWRITHQLLRPLISLVTFVTYAGRDVFKNNHRWDSAKLKVVENGALIPDESVGGRNTDRKGVRLGAVGRLVELKGHRILLQAFEGLKIQSHPDVDSSTIELHIYGSGPLEEELKQISLNSKRKDEIVFHGTVLDRESVYSNIDILVVSSETEGLSMVIIEAMARSIPVIATNVGGNPMLVKDGVNGKLIPYGDVAELETAIEYFVVNPEAVAIYGERAKEFVNEKYSLVRTQKSYMECYGWDTGIAQQ